MTTSRDMGAAIAALRRERGLTQAEVAETLGITAQAVSQWERGETLPDIMTLPLLAGIFGCSLEALYGMENAPHSVDIPADEQWRVVLMQGNTPVEAEVIPGQLREKLTVHFSGNVGSITSPVPISVEGDVMGDLSGSAVSVRGNVNGHFTARGAGSVGGTVAGNAQVGGALTVNGCVNGSANCGGGMTVNGSVGQDVRAGGDIRITGDVQGNVQGAKSITVGGEVHGHVEPRDLIDKITRSVEDGVKRLGTLFSGNGDLSMSATVRMDESEAGDYSAVLMRDGEIVQEVQIPRQGERVVLMIPGDCCDVHSMFSVAVEGSVEGDVHAAEVRVEGDVDGDIDAKDVTVEGDVNGDIDSGPLSVGGDVEGDVDCGPLKVNGDINGDVDCGPLTIFGDIHGDVNKD